MSSDGQSKGKENEYERLEYDPLYKESRSELISLFAVMKGRI